MTDKRNILHAFLPFLPTLLVVLLFSACSFEEDETCSVDNTSTISNASNVYLSVRLQLTAEESTRTNPLGGEDGNGREAGINNENVAHNVTLLLYKDESGYGINSTDETEPTIAYAYYFDYLSEVTSETATSQNVDKYYQSAVKRIAFKDAPEAGTYNVIAVANGYDLTNLVGQTLENVRDYIVTTAWTEGSTIEAYDYFVMSSEKDAEITINYSSSTGTSEDNPFVMETTVERIAARIDIVPISLESAAVTTAPTVSYNSTDNTYTYAVKGSSSGNTIGYFVLSSVVPYNCLTSGSYLIKRVYDANSSTTTYLGDEVADGNNAATNYVLDPWTPMPDASNDKATAGASYSPSADDYSSFEDRYPVQKADVTNTTDGDYYILAYTMENTFVSLQEDYVTSLAFIGTYYETSEWDATATTDNKLGAPIAGAGKKKTYYYKIRHSDPNGTADDDTIMKYGIVRNNIYRIIIDGVQGNDVDTEMKFILKVRDWAYYVHSTIVM